eukprot:Anaeramoba_flamelloidesa812869_74.p1 GENE.a812869_74~~a812869_74.p1  ORF type:complete len:457 (-),score=132.62 a812869_74:159-1358(-)
MIFISTKVEKVVHQALKYFLNVIDAQFHLIIKSYDTDKPTNFDEMQKFLDPMNEHMTNLQTLADNNRHSNYSILIKAIHETANVVMWSELGGGALDWINRTIESVKFLTQKGKIEYKTKGKDCIDLCDMLDTFLQDTKEYVVEYFKFGMKFGTSNKNFIIKTNKAKEQLETKKSVNKIIIPKVVSLQQVEKIVSERNEQIGTKTNQKQKQKAVEQSKNSNEKGNESKRVTKKREPKKVLEKKKWIIEFFENETEGIVLEEYDTNSKQIIYIHNCKTSVIKINGVVGQIFLDNCENVGIIAKQVIIGAFILNSKDIQFQIKLKIPSIEVNRTSGAKIFLPITSLHTEIETYKSSEMYIHAARWDSTDLEKEDKEIPVPERYKHFIDLTTGELISETIEHI